MRVRRRPVRGRPAVRAKFQWRLLELFKIMGCGGALANTPIGTHKYLAMLLGGARGLPILLAAELADTFDEKWGFWSSDQRLTGAI